MSPPVGSHARRTLIKPVDGKVRNTSYDLPGHDNIYGMKQTGGDEGAQSLMTRLSVHKPSAVAVSDQDIVKCNRLAVGEKVISAKDNYDYQLSHQHVKRQKPKSQSLFLKPRVPFDGPYGIASYPNMKAPMIPGQSFKPPPGSISKVIKGEFVNYKPGSAAPTYPDTSGRMHPGKMPLPRPTKSSLLKNVPKESDEKVDRFIMKRFQNVPSRVFSTSQQQGLEES